MNRYTFLLILSGLLLLTGCNPGDFQPGTIRIQLEKPAGYEDISLGNISITLSNQSQGITYTTLTDTEGKATLELTAGMCIISRWRTTPTISFTSTDCV